MYVKKLIILLTLITFLVNFSGCSEEKVVVDVDSGSISGLVQDTNGNPLSGVKVIFMDKKTTTNEGGIYCFDNVPSVTLETNQSLTIMAPIGYLGATVTIIDSVNNNNELFADVGTAVLPELNSTVSGVVRDLDTGSVVVGAEVNFDMLKGGTDSVTAQEQLQNGVTTTYAVSTYKTTTDIHGNFTLTNIPSDSTFSVYIPEYNIDSENENLQILTNNEGYQVSNIINVTKINLEDKIKPYIKDINYVVDNSVARAVLDNNMNNSITINFSELINFRLDEEGLIAYSGKDGDEKKIDIEVSSAKEDNKLTITFNQTLVAGDNLDIHLLKHNFVDKNGNILTLNNNLGYDYDNKNYISLKLKIFKELNLKAESVLDAKQLKEHISNEENDDSLIQAKSDAFKDVLDGTEKFQQLNKAEAQSRLEELIINLGGKGIEVDKTRISFTPENADKYIISVEDTTNNPIPQSNVANSLKISSNADVLKDFNNTNSLEISVDDMNNVEIYLDNVTPNDIVTITPFDELGYKGTPTLITLVDNVVPTTVLQTSYYENTNSGDNGVVEVVYGNGGELSDRDDTTIIGTPYLAITNSLLDNLKHNGSVANGTAGNTPDKSLYAELYSKSTKHIEGVYDAKGFAIFNTDTSLARTIGVSFSENIALGDMNSSSFNGTADMLSNFKVSNDVERFVDGNTILNVDLINMKVKNIIQLANNEHLKTIDYSGITDEAGNMATDATNAKVIIKDKLSPLVKSAKFDNTGNVTIKFNEAIRLVSGQTEITISGSGSSTASYNGNNRWNLSENNSKLTIELSEFKNGDSINNKSFWDKELYASPTYYNDAIERAHAYLEFNTVKDTRDNSWDSYIQDTRDESEVSAPSFEIPFMINPLEVDVKFADGSPATDSNKTNSTIIYSFNNPIQAGSADDGVLDIFEDKHKQPDGSYLITELDEIKERFSISIFKDKEGEILNNNGSTNVSLSADRKTMTFSFTAVDDNGEKLGKNDEIIAKKDGVRYINAYDTDNTKLKNSVSIEYSK